MNFRRYKTIKRTFTSTKKFDDLTKATFKLYIYDETKYGRDFDCDVIEWIYTDVISFDIIQGGQEAKEFEKEMAPDYDIYSEYLVLHFKDGSQATFRYSYVDMFILSK